MLTPFQSTSILVFTCCLRSYDGNPSLILLGSVFLRNVNTGSTHKCVIGLSLCVNFLILLHVREDVLRAKESGNWQPVLDFYSAAFDSFIELNKTFKVSNLMLLCSKR